MSKIKQLLAMVTGIDTDDGENSLTSPERWFNIDGNPNATPPAREVPLTHPEYYHVHNACVLLAKQIKASEQLPDIIVGLTRGGLLPAVLLSNLLNVPMTAVDYSSKKGAGDKHHLNIIPQINGHNVLLVDDICDSGLTLQEMYSELTKRRHFVRSAVLYYKEGMTGHDPEFYHYILPKDSGWVNFPWECSLED